MGNRRKTRQVTAWLGPCVVDELGWWGSPTDSASIVRITGLRIAAKNGEKQQALLSAPRSRRIVVLSLAVWMWSHKPSQELWELFEQIMSILLYLEPCCGGQEMWNPRKANLVFSTEGLLSPLVFQVVFYSNDPSHPGEQSYPTPSWWHYGHLGPLWDFLHWDWSWYSHSCLVFPSGGELSISFFSSRDSERHCNKTNHQ